MTYVGMGKKEHSQFKTLVLAGDDREARAKVLEKFRAWWGGDYREEDVTILAFGDGRSL